MITFFCIIICVLQKYAVPLQPECPFHRALCSKKQVRTTDDFAHHMSGQPTYNLLTPSAVRSVAVFVWGGVFAQMCAGMFARGFA